MLTLVQVLLRLFITFFELHFNGDHLRDISDHAQTGAEFDNAPAYLHWSIPDRRQSLGYNRRPTLMLAFVIPGWLLSASERSQTLPS